jgi:hypothetical protein
MVQQRDRRARLEPEVLPRALEQSAISSTVWATVPTSERTTISRLRAERAVIRAPSSPRVSGRAAIA